MRLIDTIFDEHSQRAMFYDVVYYTGLNHVLCPPKYHNVDEIQKTVKVRWFCQKEWPEICAIIFEDGVLEKMMRNASCFILLFLVGKFEHYRFATLKIYYHLLEGDFASKIRPSMTILHEENVRMQNTPKFVTMIEIWRN
jgi:hypothetical protein